ncbi:TPA: phage minor head protein [Stenotrophomonas maltophilia]
MATVGYGQVPFEQQIAFFRRKRNIVTESWLDVWESEHDQGFMVAGANRDELVADFATAIRKAIDDGVTLEQFRRDFDRIVATHGWDYNGGRNWRSRVIYETNLRQSYNAGRWHQLQALKKSRPWWRYRHSDAVETPRPLHQAWDGMVLHCDDPWWQWFFPANGWGCQCYVEALNDRDLARLGKDGPDTAPAVEFEQRMVGQRSPGGPFLVETLVGVDPGFGYAPGRSLDGWPTRRGGPQTPPALGSGIEEALQAALRRNARLPAAPAARTAAQVLERPRALDALQAGLSEWRAAAAAGRAHSSQYLVGALQVSAVDALSSTTAELGSAAIAVEAAEVLDRVPAAYLPSLPNALRSPFALLYDAASSIVRFVLQGDRRQRLVVDVRIQGSAAMPNLIQDAGVVSSVDLRRLVDRGSWQLIQGEIP